MLSCAACCHDFDKGLYNVDLKDGWRHGEGSGKFVEENADKLSIPRPVAVYVDFIISIHDFKEDYRKRLDALPDRFTAEGAAGDLRRLASFYGPGIPFTSITHGSPALPCR